MYSMKEVCNRVGLTYDTLKFYCNEGLVPNVKRDRNNYRVFNEKDVAWVDSLSCLKKCGLTIVEMKGYLNLCLAAKETIPKRNQMLDIKLKALKKKKLKSKVVLSISTGSMDFITMSSQAK